MSVVPSGLGSPMIATAASVASPAVGSPFTLVLGPVTFADLEHPTSLPLPMTQQTAVHQQAGGTRTIQTFGAQPGPIAWKGMFYFQNALERVGQLRRICAIGKPVQLSWGPWAWDVVVTTFDATVHQQYEVEYSISCAVVMDKTSHATLASIASIDAKNQALYDQIQVRFNALQQLDSTTSSWSTSLSASGQQLGLVSPFSSASPQSISAAITQVQASIALVQPYVAGLQNSTGIGLSRQLFLAQGVLSPLQLISANLGSGNPAQTVQAVGAGITSLFTLAAQHYGDPSLWTYIASANNLLSPFIPPASVTTLKIPPKPVVSSNSISQSNIVTLATV